MKKSRTFKMFSARAAMLVFAAIFSAGAWAQTIQCIGTANPYKAIILCVHISSSWVMKIARQIMIRRSIHARQATVCLQIFQLYCAMPTVRLPT